MSHPVLFNRSRGLNSVKSLLRRTAPIFSGNPDFSAAVIDPALDPLLAFEKNRTLKEAAACLSTLAATGLFSTVSLDQLYDISCSADLCKNKQILYYLSSLYLQLDEADRVDQLLMSLGVPTTDMTWFAALMIYARENGFGVPDLSGSDIASLEFIEQRLKDPVSVLQEVVDNDYNTAIVGNAPGSQFEFLADDLSTICFNDYRKNTRLNGDPVLHVVTPSWDIGQTEENLQLFITGNSIFHRRSHVWRRFGRGCDYQSVSCFPKELWSGLYLRLKAPPSAGLLMISFLADVDFSADSSLLVAGFSESALTVNHSYDRVPASSRHNWDEELIVRREALERIQNKIRTLRCVA